MPGAEGIGGMVVPEQIKFDQNGGNKDVRISEIAGGGWHTMALDDENNLWAWGSNMVGQLGVKDIDVGIGHDACSYIPIKVDVLPERTKIKSFATGGQHVAILDENGKIWSWGWNQYGQLGNKDVKTGLNAFEKIAVPVSGLDDVVITKIATSYYHTVALDEHGRVWAWGSNRYGQLGSESVADGPDNNIAQSAIAVPVSGLNDVEVVDIAAGYAHTVVMDKNGNVWAWGYNLYGQVGNGEVSNGDFFSYISRPTHVCEWRDERGRCVDTKIQQIMSTTNHSMAVDSLNNVWAWGFNRYGQLGTGGHEDANLTPRLVMWPVNSGVAPEPPSIAHVMAIDEEENKLKVEQAGFHIAVYAKLSENKDSKIVLQFVDTKKQNLFAALEENDVRIMEDRWAIAFGSHTHLDVDRNLEKGILTLGLNLRDREHTEKGKTLKIRFIRSYNDFGKAEDFDTYSITFISA